MNSGIRQYPPADRIDVPNPVQATSTSASHLPTTRGDVIPHRDDLAILWLHPASHSTACAARLVSSNSAPAVSRGKPATASDCWVSLFVQ